jgi:ribosomal protein S12 methylthiotransferase
MKRSRSDPITVGFISLGCPKNVVDSERMLAEIAQAGYLLNSDPRDADLVIINTCGFIAPAKIEAFEAITEALDWKKTGPVKKVIVVGCLAQRMGADLLAEFPGIDAVVGLGQPDT